jgi:hypothetical protein
MTFDQLIARYESGAMASHEFAVECLNQLDPSDPLAILERVPTAILPRMREFVDQYRPGQMMASHGGLIPTPAQIQAARNWLDPVRQRGMAPVGPAS